MNAAIFCLALMAVLGFWGTVTIIGAGNKQILAKLDELIAALKEKK